MLRWKLRLVDGHGRRRPARQPAITRTQMRSRRVCVLEGVWARGQNVFVSQMCRCVRKRRQASASVRKWKKVPCHWGRLRICDVCWGMCVVFRDVFALVLAVLQGAFGEMSGRCFGVTALRSYLSECRWGMSLRVSLRMSWVMTFVVI